MYGSRAVTEHEMHGVCSLLFMLHFPGSPGRGFACHLSLLQTYRCLFLKFYAPKITLAPLISLFTILDTISCNEIHSWKAYEDPEVILIFIFLELQSIIDGPSGFQ